VYLKDTRAKRRSAATASSYDAAGLGVLSAAIVSGAAATVASPVVMGLASAGSWPGLVGGG